jgi:carbon storage regulator
MLVLMRRTGEAIHIGSNIVVTLVALERNRARIGIQAPRDVVVDREEVAEKKRAEALKAACDDPKTQNSGKKDTDEGNDPNSNDPSKK